MVRFNGNNEKMKQLKTITLDNENYHIFKLERKEGILEIYFIWGKTDFRTIWEKSNSAWIRKKLQIYKKSQWFTYQKVSDHGISLEETYWEGEKDDLLITLPKNISNAGDKIFQKISPSYHI